MYIYIYICIGVCIYIYMYRYIILGSPPCPSLQSNPPHPMKHPPRAPISPSSELSSLLEPRTVFAFQSSNSSEDGLGLDLCMPRDRTATKSFHKVSVFGFGCAVAGPGLTHFPLGRDGLIYNPSLRPHSNKKHVQESAGLNRATHSGLTHSLPGWVYIQ